MTLVKINNPVNRTFDGLMNELFNELPATLGKTVREDVLNFPPVNILEKNNAYYIELAAPGMDKADFHVKLEGKLLTISAEKKENSIAENEKMIRKEFTYKSFTRSFNLDEKIDQAMISAKYENGVLLLDLPKKAEATVEAKKIVIQ